MLRKIFLIVLSIGLAMGYLIYIYQLKHAGELTPKEFA
jgi:hypothetical protein